MPYISEDVLFYLERERQEVLEAEWNQYSADTLYVIGSNHLHYIDTVAQPYTRVDSFFTRKESITMYVVHFEQGFNRDTLLLSQQLD